MLSGCAFGFKAQDKSIQLYGVEPEGADDFYCSFQTKKHLKCEKVDTIADGLRSPSVGELNFPILMHSLHEAITVTDAEIIRAMQLLWEHHQLIIEPSGAVSLAGFIKQKEALEGDAVLLISGKNVDQDAFNEWINSR